MTVIVRPSGGRWAGVDYQGSQLVTNSAIELDMVNAGFAAWSPPSGAAGDLVGLLFGDSLCANGFTNNNESTTAQNWLLTADMELGGVFTHVINGGVAGERTDAQLLRLPALLAGHRPDVLIIGPNSVNDIDPTKGPILSASQTIENYEKFLSLGFQTSSVKWIFLSKVHRPSSTYIANIGSTGDAVRAWYKQVSDWMDSKAMSDSRIRVIPFGEYANNAAGTALRINYSMTGSDVTHPGYLGARQIGNDAVKPAISTLPFTPFLMPRSISDHSNLLGPSSMLVGSFASGSGNASIATGVTGTTLPGGVLARRMTGDSASSGANAASISSPIGLDAQCAQMDFTIGQVGGGVGFQIGWVSDYKTARTNNTAYSWGHKVAIAGNGLLCAHVYTPGTSAASSPDFSAVSEGSLVQDGTVVWQICRIPQFGEQMLFEVDLSITANTGGVCPMAWINFTDDLGVQTARYINFAGNTCLAWPTATGRRLLRRKIPVPSTSGTSIKNVTVFAGAQGANGATGTIQLHGLSGRKAN